jgi:Cys-tRNA(Pro)/Cys-tRNA(Cys) deacylase
MVKSKELLPLTGYIHGGCSPIGMKKFFTTNIHSTAQTKDTIIFSAGRVGVLLGVKVEDISKVIRVSFSDLIVED